MSENELLKEILIETKKLSRLLGISITNGLNAAERITLLDRAGLSNKEIAELLNITPNLVSSTLYNVRKKQAITANTKKSKA